MSDRKTCPSTITSAFLRQRQSVPFEPQPITGHCV
jgi:hypothetical protein